ncbi:Glyco hydro 16 domain containing protein [Asbolus verrucosus]|uniref:Glyco hydro 16 domain containing protein n=1 Tax=Asbolus verrucosus TaxID=1661398 RepID=A0A482VZP0_ASBVE|nr:Glyco hydro 16 domain containing protein [Asbolus verrucosus]
MVALELALEQFILILSKVLECVLYILFPLNMAKQKLERDYQVATAIWFMPRYNQYSGWPSSGEIDLMESRGNTNLTNTLGENIGTHLIQSTIHWGPTWNTDMYFLTHAEKRSSTGYDIDFHNYQMTWTPNNISFSIDDEHLATFTPPDGGFWEMGNLSSTGYDNPWKRNTKLAPFDQEFYIIFNLACGGASFFPQSANNPGGKPWTNGGGQEMYTDFWKGKNQWLPTWKLETDSAAFKIDYVKIILYSVFLLYVTDCLNALCTPSVTTAGGTHAPTGTLDINGGAPAVQCTNPVRNGCSRTGTETVYLNPIKSARMRTVFSFFFKYGKAEVKAKLPSGDWLWPGDYLSITCNFILLNPFLAIWFLPRYSQYSSWPISGEIDLMESRGNRNLINILGENIGTQLVQSTLHWGPNSNADMYFLTHAEKRNSSGYDTDWHKYQMTWTPDNISFSVDNEHLATFAPPSGGFWELGLLNFTGYDNPWKRNTKMAPFDQEFYIILNLACGGAAFFPDYANNPGGKPWKNRGGQEMYTHFWKGRNQWLPTWKLNETDDAAFKIDYVRIWAL